MGDIVQITAREGHGKMEQDFCGRNHSQYGGEEIRDTAESLGRDLTVEWEDAALFRLEGDVGSAWACWGAILNVALSEPWRPWKDEWRSRLADVQVTEADCTAALEHARAYYRQVDRIVSAQGNLIYEEILLVLTNRIQIDFILDFASLQGFDVALPTEHADEEIAALATHQAAEYRSASNAVKRNWNLPIMSVWLDSKSAK